MKIIPDTWKQFERYMLAQLHYSPRTTTKERIRKLRHLERQGIDLWSFDPEQAYDYFAARIRGGTHGYQLNSYIKALNTWCKYREIKHTFTVYKEWEKPMKIPTAQDVGRILRKCDRSKIGKRTKALVFILANSGMRIGELCDLKLDDIDWNKNEVIVTGKGDKVRVIPVKDYVLHGGPFPSIKNYIKHHRPKTDLPFVFIDRGKRLTEAQARKDIKEVSRSAGMGWIHPHCLRHFYATNLLQHGINIKMVQILLGHSNIGTTSRYLHAVDCDIRKAITETNLGNLCQLR